MQSQKRNFTQIDLLHPTNSPPNPHDVILGQSHLLPNDDRSGYSVRKERTFWTPGEAAMDVDASPREPILELGKLTAGDFRRIRQCRRAYNRVGFAYQVAFVRLVNRFPTQKPFELVD